MPSNEKTGMFHVSRPFEVSPNGGLRCQTLAQGGLVISVGSGCATHIPNLSIASSTSSTFTVAILVWYSCKAGSTASRQTVKPSLFTEKTRIFSCRVSSNPPFLKMNSLKTPGSSGFFLENRKSFQCKLSKIEKNKKTQDISRQPRKIDGSVLVSHSLQFLIQSSFQSAVHNDLSPALWAAGETEM